MIVKCLQTNADFAYFCMMITNVICNSVNSLGQRKWRRRTGTFKAEGNKCVLDTLGHFTLRALYALPEWIEKHPNLYAVEATRGEMHKMTSLSTPPEVIAVYDTPIVTLDPEVARKGLVLALDTIQDPGNLGTIMRVADWFGVTDIVCSIETADCFSPKVVQATMGAISRVRMHYGDLSEIIPMLKPEHVYGTFLNGTLLGEAKLAETGIIVIGNEGNGISPEVEELVTDRLFIPSWPAGRPTSESLNAAMATGITLAKFRGV